MRIRIHGFMSSSAMEYNFRQVIYSPALYTSFLKWVYCYLLSRGESYERADISMMLKYVPDQFKLKIQYIMMSKLILENRQAPQTVMKSFQKGWWEQMLTNVRWYHMGQKSLIRHLRWWTMNMNKSYMSSWLCFPRLLKHKLG